VRLTVGDIDAAFSLASQFTRRDGVILTGLREGTATLDLDDALDLLVRLRGFAYVPGVRVSGDVHFRQDSIDAELRVEGDTSARGRLTLANRVWRGVLGGRRFAWRVP
jgi:hypothetical protein